VSTAATKPRRSFLGWLAGLDDGVIIRTAFFIMLAGCAAVLWIDYRELNEAELPLVGTPQIPVLPAFDPDAPAQPAGPAVTSDMDALRQPLGVKLASGGTLEVTGTIDVGSAERFKTAIADFAEYVKVVALDSPGGSVNDALEIGRMIREAKFITSVAAGALCASSCPLIFAGGVERKADPASAIGVHQIYANVSAESLPVGLRAAGAAMSDAQKTTATITRYLTNSGVDSALWLHALETPPDRLYYLSPAELTQYKLATTLAQ
jgi:hypothetical protein